MVWRGKVEDIERRSHVTRLRSADTYSIVLDLIVRFFAIFGEREREIGGAERGTERNTDR